jgi:ribosome-associated protein
MTCSKTVGGSAMQQIEIDSPYITLGQLLKRLDIVASGGEVKIYLQTETVRVNGQREMRRGKKIYPQDQVKIVGFGDVRVRVR